MRQLYSPILRIAPEAWAVIALLALLGFSAWEMGQPLTLLLCSLLGLAVGWYGFGARRNSRAKPSGVLSPVDGTVAFRRECHDPFLGREAIRIGIAIGPGANYFFRAPVEGEVLEIAGAQQSVSHLQTDEGEDIVLVVSRGWLLGARPVWLPIGERVGQGKRCGVRRAALWMDIYLPTQSRVEVALQQAVKSGETVLATLLRKH